MPVKKLWNSDPARERRMKSTPTTAERILRVLSNCDYFNGLSPDALKRLAQASHLREYGKRERLFTENRAGGLVFVLVRGAVQLTKAGRQGSEVVIRTIKPFEVFAEVVLFEADTYPVTATAVAPASVIAIDRRDFLRLLDDASFRVEYLRAAAARMRYLAQRVRNLASCDVEQRFFMFLAEHYGQQPEIRTELSKKDIAAAIGAAPETFSRMVRSLQGRRLVRWDGRCIRVSPAAWNFADPDG
jgi:CRP/FNR family transcriptional regulator